VYRYIWKIAGVVSFVCLIFVGVTFSSVAASMDPNLINKVGQSWSPIVIRSHIQQTLTGPQVEDGPQQLYLPIVVSEELSTIALINVWQEDLSGSIVNKVAPGDFVRYFASGTNINENATQANLNWTQESPCGITTIFSDTVSLSPGEWEHSFSEIIPDCTGHYTNTVRINHNGFESMLSTQFEVSLPGTVVIGSGQAFDRCFLPSLDLMRAWWDNSPYTVFNIYIGGVSFFCSDDKVDHTWLQAAYQQGWSFIPTWVGPQAPCTGFQHRMSSNASVAYQEGRAEADKASAEAHDLGMSGELIIYYDMEGYPNNYSCRIAVKSFIRGWVERLHELGAKAGVYGAACTSYVADWDSIDPKPDDVWIAHWYTNKYDPGASVFGAPCLSDTLWSNHQRLKQYAGDHTETWGGMSLRIDSNVLDGEIYRFPTNTPSGKSMDNHVTVSFGPDIHDMAMISVQSGWVLMGNSLYRTNDNGGEWTDITPQLDDAGQILSVFFLNDRQGWLLEKSYPSYGEIFFTLFRTKDGGESWELIAPNLLVGQDLPVSTASLEFIDDDTGWVSLKLQSSSNFSIGKLFATIDGGQNWTERLIPIGEPVRFINRNEGWTAGGPAGDQLYKTEDGGNIWQPVLLYISEQKPDGHPLVGLPQFDQNQIGSLPITVADGHESRLDVLISKDGGNTWLLGTSIDLTLDVEPAMPLPFSVNDDGSWRAVSIGKGDLYTFTNHEQLADALPTIELPKGVTSLDFSSDLSGWALVQEGKCEGQKIPTVRLDETYLEPPICSQGSRLFSTDDGGRSWYDISPTY
jgi:photosystem II stability/assembly factor-like uncharacterized protein